MECLRYDDCKEQCIWTANILYNVFVALDILLCCVCDVVLDRFIICYCQLPSARTNDWCAVTKFRSEHLLKILFSTPQQYAANNPKYEHPKNSSYFSWGIRKISGKQEKFHNSLTIQHSPASSQCIKNQPLSA